MKKKTLLTGLIVLCMLMATACKFSFKVGNVKKASDEKDSKKNKSEVTALADKVEPKVEEKSLDGLNFDEYNVLTSTVESRDDESYDEIIARIKIKNNGKKNIDNILLKMSFVDGSGKEVCTGTGTYDYTIDANKEAIITVYSDLNGASKSNVKNIVMLDYYYCEDANTYHVVCNEKKIEGYTSGENLGNVDFDKANVLKVATEKGKVEYDMYIVPVKFTNNSKIDFEEVGVDLALLNKDGVIIDEGLGSSDGKLNAGKSVTIEGMGDEDSVAKDIASANVCCYYYKLKEKDSNGYNYYIINLQRKTAVGMNMD